MPDPQIDLIIEIDNIVGARAMLSHPFYVKWTEGGLDIASMREYARQYFAFERAFPQFLSAVHSQIDNADARRDVLTNLLDEEASDPNHQELWLRFCEAIGADRDSVTTAELLDSTTALVDRFKAATADDPASGLAALYAYESQASDVARSKLDGLARHYSISDGPGVEFFTTHAKMDAWHAETERTLITQLSVSDEATLAAAEGAADALWEFLSGVEAAYC